VEALVKNTSETQNKNAILKSNLLGTGLGKLRSFEIKSISGKKWSELDFVSKSKIHVQQFFSSILL
jgi:hypothetical protein